MPILKKIVLLTSMSVLTACGGAETNPTVSFSTLKIWSDNAGVGRGESSDGSTAYVLTPYIVDTIAAANNAGEAETPNPNNFPVSTVYNGYEFREGVLEGNNVILAAPVGGGDSGLVYFYGPGYDGLIATASNLGSIPAGTFNYSGIYAVGWREGNWKEIGTLALAANLTDGTFTINASGSDTSLTGSGYVNTTNGQLSGSNFTLNDVDFGSHTATIVGGLGGTNAEGVAGVFYTTEDNNPRFAGGFAGER